MLIRPATAADISAWHAFRVALWPDYAPDYLDSELRDVLAQPERAAAFFAVVGDGTLVGFAEVSIRRYADGCESRDVGYLEGWYVAAAYRRQGVGRQLVQAAENWAREKGCKEMASDCLLNNAVSERAHGRLGYQETEQLIHFKKSL